MATDTSSVTERRSTEVAPVREQACDRVAEDTGRTAASGAKNGDRPPGVRPPIGASRVPMGPPSFSGGYPDAPGSRHLPEADGGSLTSRPFSMPTRHALAPWNGQSPRLPANQGRRLRVWSWWQRDLSTGKELVCVIAVGKRTDVDDARRRLELTGHATVGMEGPANPGFSMAMEQPFRLIWMALDDYVARSTRWLREEQLHALRTLAKSGPS